MIELIEKLVNTGLEVHIIIKNPFKRPQEELQKEKIVFEEKGAVKKEFIKKPAKRVNWRVINKIKEAKEDGLTSQEAAKDLNLPLEVVNKYWI